MTERERTLQLRDGLRSQGCLADLFPDWSFGADKPYDIVACRSGGRYWAIENKQVSIPSWNSKMALLGPRSFRPKQIPRLLIVLETGGMASVILFVEPPRAVETRAWALSAWAVAEMLKNERVLRLEDLGRLEADNYELVRLPQGRWGLGEHMLAHHDSQGWGFCS